jgi:catechol 2,3-dioxygenase-like lactoylglutathione lyase family enzyme
VARVQLALNVNDIDEAVDFYAKLFGTEPAKRRPGYANFAVTEPPLKLVLLENPGQGGSLNHLGVEVADVDTVDAEQTRLAELGTGLGRRARNDVLLRQAGQVLGTGRSERRAVGDLHGPGRQPDLPRRGVNRVSGVLRR